MVWDFDSFSNHEQVTYATDEETGLQAIVSVHDTTLGPALGGTRLYDYEDERAALRDGLRLSRAMTYKAAAADLDLGGGKAVIYGASDEIKSEALLRAYGRAVDDLGGKYITSVDVGTGVGDMDVIAEETDHVVGTSDGLGDPSPITAHGVFHGIRACVEHTYGRDSLSDRHVAVQGIGKVGGRLAELLAERGATVTVTDTSEEALEEFVATYDDAERVATDDIYDVSCDVFAPCAMGGVIDDETIPRLDCDIVAGAANNILDARRHAEALRERGVLYAPDYVLNAGGLITVAKEHTGGTREVAFEEAEAIGDRLLQMIERAEERDTTVLDAAEEYAMERTDSGGKVSLAP
jgi:leucine dehydrogenase